jgi:protein associated with RNAse G/E
MVALKGKVVCETLEDAFKLRELRLKTVKEIYTLDGNVLRDDGMISINGEFDKNRKTYRFDNDGQKKIEKEMAVLQKKKSEL